MRSKLFAATAALSLLGACNWQDGQANNAQGNVSAGDRPPAEATGTTAGAPTGVASKDEAAKIMKQRHESMEKIGKAMKAAGRELKADSPNLATIRASASTIADESKHTGTYFPQGTGPDVGKTGAKADIWANPQDFTAKVAAFQKAAQAFNTSAAGNSVPDIKKSFDDLGGSCKACHDKYRAEMKH